MRPLKFLSSKTSIEQEINGELLKFYSARPGVVAGFEALANDVVKALQVMFRDDEKLRGSSHNVDRRGQRRGEDGKTPAGWASENISTTTMPIDPEVLAAADDKTAASLSGLVRSLLGKQSQEALAALVVSSMRDDFEADPETGEPLAEDCKRLLRESDIETFVLLSSAAIRANWKGLATGFRMTLPKKASGLFQKGEQALDRVLEKMGNEHQSESSSIEPASTSSEQASPEERS